ncbi:MAG TPA: hypothetical protein VEV21_10535 [Burkholderiales bacterium]|nr:hypothetical protein [Burkholderiales bacterium]
MAVKQLLAAACVAMNCGCAALSTDCAQNWYESGERHGRLGIQAWDVQYAAACGSRFDQTRYVAGWQAGASARPAQPGS